MMEPNPVIKQEATMRTINFLPNIKMENNSAFAGIPIIQNSVNQNKQQEKFKNMKTETATSEKTESNKSRTNRLAGAARYGTSKLVSLALNRAKQSIIPIVMLLAMVLVMANSFAAYAAYHAEAK